ncbi:hypothetical protein B0J18DRAFT_405655 [Chaetomium sp. MPI-SDFR-AT-0129]|nr:hypothetical protein B0J18DRAFT_405655 [Chaetomium sp. MPI-SDFR-AT-0129]
MSSQAQARPAAPTNTRPAASNTSTKNTTAQNASGSGSASETVPQPTPQERRVNAITHVIDALDSNSIPYGIDGDMAWIFRGMQNHKVLSIKVNAVATGAKIRTIFANDDQGTDRDIRVKIAPRVKGEKDIRTRVKLNGAPTVEMYIALIDGQAEELRADTTTLPRVGDTDKTWNVHTVWSLLSYTLMRYEAREAQSDYSLLEKVIISNASDFQPWAQKIPVSWRKTFVAAYTANNQSSPEKIKRMQGILKLTPPPPARKAQPSRTPASSSPARRTGNK